MLLWKRFLALALLGFLLCTELKAQVPGKTWYDSLSKKKIRSEFTYNNLEDSLLIGPFKSYHPNGKLAMTGQYIEGKKDGLFIEYFPNGRKRLEAEFKEGRKEGKMWAYDTSGQLLQRAYFSNNQLNDSLLAWYPGGVLKSKALFLKDSIEGIATEYYRTGIIKKELSHKRGRPNGPSKEYYPSGVLYIDAWYVDGFLTGDYKVYFDNGQLDTESHLEKGTRNGGFTSYTREGKKILEGFYLDGVYHGNFKTYYPEGPLKSLVNWNLGKKEGEAEYYFASGKIKEKVVFKTDRKIRSRGWFENGLPEFEKEFGKDEKPGGNWVLYFPNGKVSEKKSYDVQGRLSGKRTLYDSVAHHKTREEDWLHGLLTGKVKTYFADGKVKEIFLYQGNYIQGLFEEFHPNGKLHVSGLYKNSRKNGKWTYTDPTGAQYKIETWRNGKLLGTKNIRFQKAKK